MKNKLQGKSVLKDEDEKAINILKKIMPNIFSVIEEIFKRIENFDPASPQTSLSEAEDLVNSLSLNLYGREKLLLKAFRLFLRKTNIKDGVILQLKGVIKLTKKEASKDERYSLLLKLMREADEKFPYVSIIVAMRHGDIREWIIPQSNPLPFLKQAENSIGEQRASAVLEAFRRTVEHLYDPYITTLWHLIYFREGKDLEKRPDIDKLSFGQRLNAASEKLKGYSGIIKPDAGWMRNYITHEIPKYDVKSDSWEMKNSKHQISRIKVEELLALTDDIYQISAVTIARVGQLYLLRDFFLGSGLLEILVDNLPVLLLENDKNKEKGLETKISEHFQNIFTSK